MSDKTYYELYRRSSIGQGLTDALDDLISSNDIEPQLAMKVVSHFDKAFADIIAERVKARLSFKGSCDTYRFCDEVWTFKIKDVNFKLDNQNPIKTEKVNIVACNSRRPDGPLTFLRDVFATNRNTILAIGFAITVAIIRLWNNAVT